MKGHPQDELALPSVVCPVSQALPNRILAVVVTILVISPMMDS